MKVVLAEHMGLCFGVRRALGMAERCIAKGDTYCVGDLIHNPQEMQRLQRLGLNSVEHVDGVPATATVLLRTHGSPPQLVEELRARGVKVADATCPHVRAAQRAARRLASAGYTVVVVGDGEHPEVRSHLDWACGKGVVVSEPAQAENLIGKRFGVISQTTMQKQKVCKVIEACRKKGEVVACNTICNATALRQEATEELAERVATVIVVGGRNSANTRQLAEVARSRGASTILVESAAEMQDLHLEHEGTVGVTAGASTPDWIIKEVVDLLEELEKQPAPDNTEKREEALESENTHESEQAHADAEIEEAPEVSVEGEAQASEPPINEEQPEEADVEPSQDEQEQATAVEEHEPPRVGDIVDAIVVTVEDSGVMVDIGYKGEGFIDRKELGKRPDVVPSEVVAPGDTIKAMVLSLESAEGAAKLSKRRADEVLAWARLKEAMETGETVEAPVVQQVKGGLVVDVNLRGFVPASQVELGFVSDLSKYVGETLALKVIELDKSKNRVILSRRSVLEEQAEADRAQAWERIKEGDVLNGVVKSITDFGAFVDLGGVDGLLHVSELSWGRVKHPSDVLSEGQEIPVKVLRMDEERGRISLGYKQTQPDPWSKVEENYPVGSMVKGVVTRTAPFGAFVEIEEGVEGLVHISELSNQRVSKPEEVVSSGLEVTAKVLRVNGSERRISLSLREADERPAAKQAKPKQQEAPPASDMLTIGDVLGDKLQEALEGKKPERE